jgi:hypothetical protein
MNLSSGWAGADHVRPAPLPVDPSAGVGGVAEVYPSNAEMGSAEPGGTGEQDTGDVLSGSGEVSEHSSGALLAAAGPGPPFQGGSALRSIIVSPHVLFIRYANRRVCRIMVE